MAALKTKFTKKDLRDNMVVEFRNNPSCPRQLVVGDLLRGPTEFTRLDQFGRDLKPCEPGVPKWTVDKCTIDRVYATEPCSLNRIFDDDNLTLIWERPVEETHKEMTVEEIEKELGYKIKVVGGQNG